MRNFPQRFFTTKLFKALILTGVMFLLAGQLKLAQASGTLYPTLILTPDELHPGASVELRVLIPLTSDLHLYGPKVAKPYFATSVRMIGSSPILWSDGPIYPATKTLRIFNESFEVLEPDPAAGGIVIRFKGHVKDKTSAGEFTLKAEVTYQACSATSCTPPVLNKSISTRISVLIPEKKAEATSQPVKLPQNKAAAPSVVKISPIKHIIGTIENKPETKLKPKKAETKSASPKTGPITVKSDKIPPATHQNGLGTTISLFDLNIDLKKEGLWIPLIIAFIAGLILNIMPCVLPVIPIKILQLTHQAQKEHHSPLKLSLIFASGIITFFLAIAGMALFLKGGFSWGQTFQSSTALITLSLILVLLALGMFDVYQITVPQFIAGRSFVQKGFLGAFSMGFLAGILSTPCSFGILGAAVAWAQSQAAWVTMLGFLAIGLGMAFPYVLLSTFPGLLARIPKTGRWSELFKQSMGFLLLAVAIFLVSSLPKERILWAMLYMVLMAFIVWFWGVVLEFQKAYWARLSRVGAVGVLVLGGWGMLRSEPEPLHWQRLTPESLMMAQNSGKDVIIEFTADWCINCRTVEYLVFNDQKIKSFLKDRNVILLRGDLTEGDPYTKQALKEWTGTDAPPFTIIFKADNHRVLLPGIYTTGDLIQAIQTTPDNGRSTWNEG